MTPASVHKAKKRMRKFVHKRISEPLADAAAAAGAIVPFPVFRRINSRAPAVLCYHTVSDEPPRHIVHLHGCHTVKIFERQLDELLRNFEPIEDPTPGNILNGGSRRMLLTFDDGLREMYDTVAPILERKGINAVFFIIPSFIDNKELFYCYKASLLIDAMKENGAGGDSLAAIGELLKDHGCLRGSIDDSLRRIRYADRHLLDTIADILGVDYGEYLRRVRPFITRAEVADLHDRGFIIGAHSMDHPRYHEVSADEQVRQTVESARAVREWLQCRYAYFAFPFYMKNLDRDFFQRTGKEIDLYFSTDGWLPPERSKRVVHRTELDDHTDIIRRLKQKGLWRS
jgi:peptidoglycan/xylan/chitin deacetylase (PgdA/CDA1 family)